MRNRLFVLGMTAMLALGLVACGDNDESTEDTETTSMDEEMGESNEQFSFGMPGEASEADRTVEVKMLDTLQFEPNSIEVMPGETVTFKVTNTSGSLIHEFIIGDKKFQDEHEQEMAAMAQGQNVTMADEPYGINIKPGATEDLTWTFPDQPGETIYFVCHEPGHHTSMTGEFTVAVADSTATTTGGAGAPTTMAGHG